MSSCNQLICVLTRDSQLVMPVWFVARHTRVIISHIPFMCVTHVPIIVVFDFTLLIGGWLALLSWGGWYLTRTTHQYFPLVALHTHSSVVACLHSHNLPFIFHVKARIHTADCSDTMAAPAAGTFVVVGVVALIQCIVAPSALCMACVYVGWVG